MSLDEELKIIFTDTVTLSVEFLAEQKEYIDNVYIYGNIENNTYFFDLFFSRNNLVLHKEEIVELRGFKGPEKDNLLYQVLDLGIEDLLKIEELFEKHNQDIPTELKITFNVKNHHFDMHLSYEQKLTDDENITQSDLFEDWEKEVKETLDKNS